MSFPENSEEKKSTKKRHRFWAIVGSAFLILLTAGNLYDNLNDNLKPHFRSFQAEWPLRQYKKDISHCTEEAKKQLGNQKVFGLEYACAIEKAAAFYNTNPEQAIQLCMKYNPLFDIQLGREYSSFEPDDLAAQRDEQIVRVSCKVSIEKELEKASTSSNFIRLK
ncbi:MAG TPA: hypothetical protein VJA27_03400 [Patescibacteria group bacterium]|nr:hypothetical protein [Patescibacteria group bacterium]